MIASLEDVLFILPLFPIAFGWQLRGTVWPIRVVILVEAGVLGQKSVQTKRMEASDLWVILFSGSFWKFLFPLLIPFYLRLDYCCLFQGI